MDSSRIKYVNSDKKRLLLVNRNIGLDPFLQLSFETAHSFGGSDLAREEIILSGCPVSKAVESEVVWLTWFWSSSNAPSRSLPSSVRVYSVEVLLQVEGGAGDDDLVSHDKGLVHNQLLNTQPITCC